jgi:hypothetical protein
LILVERIPIYRLKSKARMRILFTIAHYFTPSGRRASDGRPHGSLGKKPEPRVEALSACIRSLHENFGSRQVMMEPTRLVARPVNQWTAGSIDVVICTTRNCHVLDRLPIPANHFTHHGTDAEPMLLGFECQRVLRDRLGGYDYFCFLEDDLVLHDPWFFRKLGWFSARTGDENLLQPNRFEVGPNPLAAKVYLDGDLPKAITRKFQDVRSAGVLESKVLGARVRFRRALNPHSGCYFLNATQMDRWAKRPYFLDRDVRFVGPLESAATLGIMRTFRVYKPAAENAAFLEVQHFGTAFLGKIRHQAKASPPPDSRER